MVVPVTVVPGVVFVYGIQLLLVVLLLVILLLLLLPLTFLLLQLPGSPTSASGTATINCEK